MTAKFEPTDIGTFTAELASNFNSAFESAGLYLDLDIEPMDGPVAVDREMWEKIVLNLLSNAFKFTLEGGVKLILAKVGDQLELVIADTGVGISQDHLPRIFDRFHRIENQKGRTHEGTGIGLALVNDLAKLHGGAVHVSSIEKQGTTFTVRIPANSDTEQEGVPALSKNPATARAFVEEALRWLPAGQSHSEPSDTSANDAKAIIVLADDNADMRAYITRLLDTAGYVVVSAADGEAALAAVQQHAPALVLSDVMMPLLDGLGLVRALRADPSTASIPIILLSARTGVEAEGHGLDAGADDYITKPFVAQELIARVKATIGRAQGRAEMLQRAETSAKQLRLVADALPALVSYVDRDERYTFSNQAYHDWFGHDATGQTIEEVLGKEVYDLVLPRVRTALAGEKVSFEGKIPYKDGGARRVEASYVPDIDSNGLTRGYIAMVYDLTERLRKDAALAESEARFREMADNSPVMIWVTEADGGCSYLSQRWYEFTGQTREEALGFGWLNAICPEDKLRVRKEFEAANERNAAFTFDYRLRRSDGEYRWCIDAASPRVNANGDFLGYVGSVVDITDLKKTEEALRAARDTFRLLVDRSPFGIYTVDADFRLFQVSEGAQHVFANVSPLIGRDFAEVLRSIWPEPFASEAIGRFRHTLETGEPYHSSTTVERRADIDAVEAYEWKIERLTLPDGRPGAVCHFYDLTERQAYQEKIEFLMREVNHRAKNMLALVVAVAKQTITAQPDDFLDRFSARVQAMAASQDLLVQTDWEGTDLVALIESQMLHFKDLVGERIILQGPDVYVSPKAAQTLGMAVHELATNAAKYGALSNEQGLVEISWQLAQEADVCQFEISWIEKNGPEVTQPSRLGFGQRVAKTIVEVELAGKVTLEYLPTGLEWTLRCDLSAIGNAKPEPEAEPEPEPEAHDRQATTTSSKTLLIVEDDIMLALDLTDSMLAAGYEVIGPAASVAQAFDLLQKHVPTLAILDINLGAETSEPIAHRLNEKGVPFICMSGYSKAQQPQIFQESQFLSKPVHLPSLLQEIERAISRDGEHDPRI